MNKTIFLFYFICLVAGNSFSQSKGVLIKNDLETESNLYPWINLHTIISGDAWSGQAYSRTDSINLYGAGWKGPVPELFWGKNICLGFEAYARFLRAEGNSSVVISVMLNDSVVYWENRPLRSRVKELNVWTPIKDSLSLPSNITGPEYILLIYPWNEDGRSEFDIDDISIRFDTLKFSTYLIESDTLSITTASEDFMNVYSGVYFRMDYNKISGQFRILSPNQRVLLESFSYYLSWREEQSRNKLTDENIRTIFFLRGEKQTEEGKLFTLETRSDIGDTKIELLFSDLEPLITFSSTTIYNRSLLLIRQSLSASYGPDLMEVYRNSTLSDSNSFQDEYWLGKGGFQVHSDSAGFIIYKADEISSIQLNPPKKRFTVNFDWEMDHPLLHWPLLKSSENIKENHSSSKMNKGSVLKGKFTVQGLREFRKIPKILKYPNGFSATLIWTEHADYSDIRLQRAVNFGSDQIVNSRDAEGGFVKHKIPVTKSVFFSNPDKVMNSVKVGFIDSEVASIQGTPGFKEFLVDLADQGQEICLHTPDHFTCTSSLLESAVSFCKNEFNSVSWIDHGYDNSPKSNRENLVCDGLTEKSDHRSLDIWKEFGLKYFWNCFYEDTNIFSRYTFNSFFSQPYFGWGDRFPVPEYWQHSTRSQDLLHWRTTGTLDPPDGGMWSYYFNDSRLQDLLKSRATAILHCYPSRADSTNGFYEFRESHFKIQNSLELALQKQAGLRDKGLLQLVSIKDYLDYQTALRNVELRFLTNGKVRVENKGDVDLKGLTFALTSGTMGVRGKKIQSRSEADETFYWFDLNKGEVVLIDLVP